MQPGNITDKCIDCGRPIGQERLKVLPDTQRCRNCQEAYEEKIALEKGESIVYGETE